MKLTRRRIFTAAAGAAVAVVGGKALKVQGYSGGPSQPIAPTSKPDLRTPEQVLADDDEQNLLRAERMLEPAPANSPKWVEYATKSQRAHLKRLATKQGIPFTAREDAERAEIIFIHNRVIAGYIPG